MHSGGGGDDMLIKMGVDVSRLRRGIRKALNRIDNVVGQFGEECVITSTYEGNHSPSSLHYGNDAVDIRNPKENFRIIFRDLKDILGVDYDVVKERDHIHIEYDPK